MLDFRVHFINITKDVKKLAKAPARRKLSKLPKLRILRRANTIHGLEFNRLSPLHQDNATSTIIREASIVVANSRQEKRTTLHGQVGTKEYDKLVRQKCRTMKYSHKLIKHLAPLWELGMHKWNKLITIQRDTNEDYTIYIQPTDVNMARLPNGDKPGIKASLRITINYIRATLFLTASSELR
jgi:hypothetical protein